jgi:hypothetical protein
MAKRERIAHREDETKFRELVLYVSQKCAIDPRFGATKLNKVLFYSDFFAFAKTGKPITGFVYQRLRNGPAPRRLVPVRDKMISDRILALQDVQLKSGKVQKRTVNLRSPKLGVFTADEIAIVDYIIDALSDCDAQTVSDISHRMVGWQIASEGEDIPYETVFLSNEPLTEAEVARGKEIAAEIKRTAA